MSEISLDDLLEGRDKLLTSGEVAEILNVNANTLYLWRTSEEVVLPFQRFVAPGQTRGMIRYRYSDVADFIEAAANRGERESSGDMSEGDAEILARASKRIEGAKAKTNRKKRNKAKAKTLDSASLDEAWQASGTFDNPLVRNRVNDEDVVKDKAEEALRELLAKFDEIVE